MAFKVLCVVLFICLIDSLHSASLQRMKRNDNEAVTTAASTDNKGSEATTTKPGSPGFGGLFNVPQINQKSSITNLVSQNQANSLVPDNYKKLVSDGVPSSVPSGLSANLPSCLPSGIPGSEHENTKEPEKSDGGDHSGSSSNGGVQENLQFKKITENMKNIMSNKEITKLDLSKIPIGN